MSEIHFTYFFVLFFIFLIPVYFYFRWKEFQNSHLQLSIIQFQKPKNFRNKIQYLSFVLEGLFLLFSLIGISDPHKLTERKKILDKGIDLVLALDVSASMQADDFKPNRLEAMKEMAKEFIKHSGGNRIGITIFAQDSFTQTPLTINQKTLLDLIDSISFHIIDHSVSGGTAVGDALLSASDSLLKNKIENREQAILLITDGESSHGIDSILVAKYIASKNISLYSIGMAGEEPVDVYVDGEAFLTSSGKILTTSLNDSELIEISKYTKGKYFRAKDNFTLSEIFSEISSLASTPLEIKISYNKNSYSYFFAGICFFIFCIWLTIEIFFLRKPIR